MHMTEAQRRAKPIRHLSQFIVMLYDVPCFSDSFEASLLMNVLVSALHPPVQEYTIGVKDACYY